MSRILPAAAGLLTVFALAAGADRLKADDERVNTLTRAETSAGWRLLFDGKTLAGWRGFASTTPPEGWKVVDGALSREGRGGDLVTVDQFSDFELRLQWKLGPGGNSGIFFHAVTEGDEIWHSAPEVQVLDNAGHRDGKIPARSAGANYDLHAPVRDVTRPVGEWNDVRVIVKGPHVEHWMNGVKLLEYELWSADWEARVKASKFAEIPTYGRSKTGHIGLQDHGVPVWYRNIKVRQF